MNYVAILAVGLSQVSDVLADQHASVTRLFDPIDLGPLSRDDALDLLDTGMASAGMAIADDARESIIAAANGLPNELQRIAYVVFDAVDDSGRDRIELADVQAARGRAG
jgi:hypothetical protein